MLPELWGTKGRRRRRKEGWVGRAFAPPISARRSLSSSLLPCHNGGSVYPPVSRHPSKKQEEKKGGEDAELRMKLDVLPFPLLP